MISFKEKLLKSLPYMGLYFFFYATFMIVLSFWGIYLEKNLHFSNQDIAIIVAVPSLLRVIGDPFFGYISSRFNISTRLIQILLCLSLIIFLGFLFVDTFNSFLLLSVVYGFFWWPVLPLSESNVLKLNHLYGISYGFVRLWGTLAGIFVGFVSGVIVDSFGISIVPVMIIIGIGITFTCSLFIKVKYTKLDSKEDNLDSENNHNESSEENVGATTKSTRSLRLLILNKKFMGFLAVGMAVQLSHAMLYTYGGIYWDSLNFDGKQIAWLFQTGALADGIVFFALSNFILNRSPYMVAMFAATVATLRWTAFPFISSFETFMFLQLLNGVTYACMHLAIMQYIKNNIAHNQWPYAQSLYASIVYGLGLSIVMILCGTLEKYFGWYSFLAMAVIALLGFAGAFAMLKLDIKEHAKTES